VKEIQKLTRDRIHIVAQTLILGDGLELRAAYSPTVSANINLAKLRQGVTLPSGGASTLPELSRTLDALEPQIVVPVRTTGDGCAAVAITLFDDNLAAPLDNVVRRLGIGAASGCSTKSLDTKPLETGKLALLASPYTRKADAALYIFDMEIAPGRPATPAFFLLGGAHPSVHSWKLERQLGSYLGGPGGGSFRSDLSAARSCFDTNAAGACYATVANHLRSVVFPSGPEAQTSYGLLQDLAKRQPRPTVFFRLVNKSGDTTLLPLGLLGFDDGSRLAEKVDAILPMPRERPADAGSCIASWTVVIPNVLDEADKFLGSVRPSPDWIRSWDGFVHYATDPGNAASPRGEGFVLLSHHGGGKLTFTPKSAPTRSLIPEEIKHHFPRGSVALLAACGVAQLGEDNEGLPLLNKLNSLGIDTAIVSPFDVRAPIGARFAIQFANEVQKAREAKKPADLLELLQKSREAVRRDNLSKAFADELDEFVVMGSNKMALCAPPS